MQIVTVVSSLLSIEREILALNAEYGKKQGSS